MANAFKNFLAQNTTALINFFNLTFNNKKKNFNDFFHFKLDIISYYYKPKSKN